jgi:4,5:9,10-diseco-3-hydroxy-5,9,17-trioxoandrosta-1(10),2-diene-4-oate hydrolase
MTQMVFIHGPGAGGCADAFVYQLEHYPVRLAPTLPGHPQGTACASVERYAEWLRGWLWAQGKQKDLVLVGYTLGGCIALRYALDYPEEVKALVLMTTGMRPRERAPGALELRLKAAADPESYRQWLDLMRHQFLFMPPELGDHLVDCHRRVGPMSQYRDFVVIDHFDVRDRIHTLKAPLLLIRGVDDPAKTPEYEREIHDAVPGAQYLKLSGCGHFPFAEKPAEVNRAIDEFLASQS